MLNLINKENNLLLIIFTIILNYLLYLTPYLLILIKINFLLFIFFSVYYLLVHEKNKFLIIFIILLIGLNLGVYTDSWDARSIWVFKTKQIFYENSILFSKDNYAQFSHPDYPNLAPAFSSAFVSLIGYWNEIFPKLGFTLMFIPSLILISRFFDTNKFLLILIFTIFVIGKYFVNGELDGLIAIYFASCALIVYKISFKENDTFTNRLIFIGFAIILSLLKQEGFILLLSLMLPSVFYTIYNKKNNFKLLLCYFITILPAISWNIFCIHYKIDNSNTIYAYKFDNLLTSIQQINNYLLIFKYLILNEKFLYSIIFFTLSALYFNQKKNIKIYFNGKLNLYTCFIHCLPINTSWD